MNKKTSTDRSQALRERRHSQGLKEVRGIWATPEQEKLIKEYAKKLSS